MSEKSTIFKQHLFKKNHMNFFYIFTREGGGGGRGRGQGGCEQRIEVFVKIQKKNNFFLGGGGGVRWGGGGSVAERVRWGVGLVGQGSGWM